MTYLLTSRLQCCWPNQGPAVMLSPGCLSPLPDPKGYEVHKGNMLECPWSDHDELNQALCFVESVYSEMIEILASSLNQIHNTAYSVKYWQLLGGPWLRWFIHVMYDRFVRLKLASVKYPDLKLIALNQDSFVTIVDSLDFVNRSKHDDLYNLQVITRMAQYMGIQIEEFRHANPMPKEWEVSVGTNPQSKNYLKLFIKSVLDKIELILKKNAKVLFYSTYHPRNFLRCLTALSWGRMVALPSSTYRADLITSKKDHIQRKRFEGIIQKYSSSFKNNDFQSFLLSVLPEEFPLVFLEGYQELEKISSNNFKNLSPQTICSAVGWYLDESFKWWIAKSAEQGIKLFGLQHGGNYGISDALTLEDYEVSILDGYLTWGWTNEELKKPIISTPAQKLLDIIQYHLHNSMEKEILFVSTSPCRFLIMFPAVAERSLDYLEWQMIFFSTLDKAMLPLIRFRPHHQDYTWKMVDNLRYRHPELTFEGWDINFRDSLSNCKIFVCDHLSTTFVEALASNTPTILFWDPQINKVRKKAQPFFEGLRRVGILHDTPESAAAWVEKVYPDVDRWWNQKTCQEAVHNFCRNYGRVSPSPLFEWLNILKKHCLN